MDFDRLAAADSDTDSGTGLLLREPSPEWQWLQQRWLVWLGHVSFGIYLWHFQVMRVLVLLYPDLWDTPATSLLALLISCRPLWPWLR